VGLLRGGLEVGVNGGEVVGGFDVSVGFGAL